MLTRRYGPLIKVSTEGDIQMHDLIKDNPALAHLQTKIDSMFVAKDGSHHPTKKLADIKDAGFGTNTTQYKSEQKKVMGIS